MKNFKRRSFLLASTATLAFGGRVKPGMAQTAAVLAQPDPRGS